MRDGVQHQPGRQWEHPLLEQDLQVEAALWSSHGTVVAGRSLLYSMQMLWHKVLIELLAIKLQQAARQVMHGGALCGVQGVLPVAWAGLLVSTRCC